MPLFCLLIDQEFRDEPNTVAAQYVARRTFSRTPGSRVQIPLGAYMYVRVFQDHVMLFCVCDLAMSWSPVQGLPPVYERVRRLVEWSSAETGLLQLPPKFSFTVFRNAECIGRRTVWLKWLINCYSENWATPTRGSERVFNSAVSWRFGKF